MASAILLYPEQLMPQKICKMGGDDVSSLRLPVVVVVAAAVVEEGK